MSLRFWHRPQSKYPRLPARPSAEVDERGHSPHIMTLYSEAPQQLHWNHIKPTLLVCWWATLFSTIIILSRVVGRFIRSEKLFTEDKMALLCLVPLYIRMALVHVILLFGTNNADFSGRTLSAEEFRRRAIGSGLVLASRVFYSAT